MGLYEIPSTTSDVLAQMILDVLIRFGLSVDNLRAQTYDGAANMSGCHTGCQARVREKTTSCSVFSLWFAHIKFGHATRG